MAHVILCSNNCISLNHILPFVLILFCLFCKPICLPPLRSPCDFIRSYPFAILFEAFPLTTDNFDRTVRQLGKDSVSAFPSFGQNVVIQLSCNTLLSPSIPADYSFSIQYFGLPFMPHRPFARRPRRIGEGDNH